MTFSIEKNTVEVEPADFSKATNFFTWTEQMGRIPSMKMELPTDATQCADVIALVREKAGWGRQ
jgi:hypothetical protein